MSFGFLTLRAPGRHGPLSHELGLSSIVSQSHPVQGSAGHRTPLSSFLLISVSTHRLSPVAVDLSVLVKVGGGPH